MAVVCFSAAVVVPFFGFIPGLLTMVPVVYVAALGRHWWLAFLMVLLASILLYLLFQGTAPVLGFLIEYGLPAVVLSYITLKGYSRLHSMVLAAAGSTCVMVLAVSFYAAQHSLTPMVLLQQAFQTNLEMVQSVYRDMGMAEEQLLFLQNSSSAMGYWAGMLFPSLLFGAYFLLSGLTVTAVVLLSRWRKTTSSWKTGSTFEHFAVYQQVVWLFIGCWVLLLVPGVPEFGRFFLWNGIAILGFFYFLQGMAIIHCCLQAFQVRTGGRFFIYFLLFAFHFLLVAVAMAGLFDLWVDFRRIARRRDSDQGHC